MIVSDIDDCAGYPCGSFGQCTDLIENYTCACAQGYTGNNCETGKFATFFCSSGEASYEVLKHMPLFEFSEAHASIEILQG